MKVAQIVLFVFLIAMSIASAKIKNWHGRALEYPSNTPSSTDSCGGVSEGLQLCSPGTSFEATRGGVISFEVKIENVSTKGKSLSRDVFLNDYQVSITDSKGAEVKSNRELLEERAAAGRASEKELIEALPLNHKPKIDFINPGKSVSIFVSLDSLYQFPTSGIYKIDIARKLPDGVLVWLPTVTLRLNDPPGKN